MPDPIISSKLLAELAPVLTDIEKLSPPPKAKGRYALAKVSAIAGPAFTILSTQQMALATRLGTDHKQAENGGVTFSIPTDRREEWATESAALLEETVTLTGCRMITNAELGECPLTIQQVRVLIACGLLEDVEPA